MISEQEKFGYTCNLARPLFASLPRNSKIIQPVAMRRARALCFVAGYVQSYGRQRARLHLHEAAYTGGLPCLAADVFHVIDTTA
jgi:hypothetical protein